MADNVYYIDSSAESAPEPEEGTLQGGGGNGTSDGMDRVWEKLQEHDARFDRIESRLEGVASELSYAKFWFVGVAFAIGFAGLGLVYAAQQNVTATMGAALSAIQTVISDRPQPAPAQQPTVIMVPAQTPSPSVPSEPDQQ